MVTKGKAIAIGATITGIATLLALATKAEAKLPANLVAPKTNLLVIDGKAIIPGTIPPMTDIAPFIPGTTIPLYPSQPVFDRLSQSEQNLVKTAEQEAMDRAQQPYKVIALERGWNPAGIADFTGFLTDEESDVYYGSLDMYGRPKYS